MNNLQKILEEIGALQKECQRRNMIYQCEEKEAVAKDNGLPLDAYYNLPYPEWAAIRQVYHDSLKHQGEHCRDVEQHHGLLLGLLSDLPLDAWRNLYKEWKASE